MINTYSKDYRFMDNNCILRTESSSVFKLDNILAIIDDDWDYTGNVHFCDLNNPSMSLNISKRDILKAYHIDYTKVEEYKNFYTFDVSIYEVYTSDEWIEFMYDGQVIHLSSNVFWILAHYIKNRMVEEYEVDRDMESGKECNQEV